MQSALLSTSHSFASQILVVHILHNDSPLLSFDPILNATGTILNHGNLVKTALIIAIEYCVRAEVIEHGFGQGARRNVVCFLVSSLGALVARGLLHRAIDPGAVPTPAVSTVWALAMHSPAIQPQSTAALPGCSLSDIASPYCIIRDF